MQQVGTPLRQSVAVEHPQIQWFADPAVLAPLALLVWIYVRRFREARREAGGRGAGPLQALAFGGAMLALLAALVSPVDGLGSDYLFSAHMLQHVLLGDIAPLLLLLSLSRVIMRPATRRLARVERALGPLASPWTAIALWLGTMYVWHIPALYDAAAEQPLLHALEHLSFFTAGVVMWTPVLETLPAPAWFGSAAKLAYIVVVRLVSTLIANVFLWSGDVFYSPYAGVGLSDQATAGAILLVEGSLVTFAAFAWLFLRLFAEGERRQELLEQGTDPRTVERAVRFGRADDLS